MPEAADSGTTISSAGAGPDGPAGAAAETGKPRGVAAWCWYLLGLALQTFLWFLLFLAIVVAVLVGHQLTEFRYVGF